MKEYTISRDVVGTLKTAGMDQRYNVTSGGKKVGTFTRGAGGLYPEFAFEDSNGNTIFTIKKEGLISHNYDVFGKDSNDLLFKVKRSLGAFSLSEWIYDKNGALLYKMAPKGASSIITNSSDEEVASLNGTISLNSEINISLDEGKIDVNMALVAAAITEFVMGSR